MVDRLRTDVDLAGLRILVLLPPANKDHTLRLVRVITEAKAYWNWHVDAVCLPRDRESFKELVAPTGKLFERPSMLEPAAWERDRERTAAVDHCLSEAELSTGVPAGQLILGGELGIGRAFVTSARHLVPSPLSRRVLRDNSEPLRVIRRLFAAAADTISSSMPEVVLASEWATPAHSTFWLAAADRGIACIAIRRSKIRSEHCFWTADRLMLNSSAQAAAIAKQKSGLPVSDTARTYIEAFREKPSMVKYIQTKWSSGLKRGWLSWHLRFGRTVASELLKRHVYGYDPALHPTILGRLVAYNRQLILSRRHQHFFHILDEAELAGMKYIYCPLHKEPELALRFQATAWHDQRNTVQVLASLLPAGYRLLVREHRLNYGTRPTEYYRRLSQLPNVVLVNPFDSQFKYLRHADLIVTENGTSGWEGLLLGRRVITLARTLYDGAGLAVRVHDPDQLGTEMLKALHRPAVVDPEMHERSLASMIDAEWETTFPMGPEGTEVSLDHLSREIIEALGLRVAAPRAAAS